MHQSTRSKRNKKAAVLLGDDRCNNMFAFYVYGDVKPVYFLSMAAENIKWIDEKRRFHDSS